MAAATLTRLFVGCRGSVLLGFWCVATGVLLGVAGVGGAGGAGLCSGGVQCYW